MKALSMSQPYAELAASGKKTIELRTWKTNFRGRFLIHAPQSLRKADCSRLKIDCSRLPRGAIVGVAEIYGIVRYETASQLRADAKRHLAGSVKAPKYGFMLKNAKKLRVPVPLKGSLGFFEAGAPGGPQPSPSQIRSEIIDEDYRYQWIGHH